MLIAIVFLLLVALWRPRLTGLLWMPALFFAIAAMHWTVSLHLADPLASLYAFLAAAFISRVLLEWVVLSLLPRAGKGRMRD
jgi:hypothetical protein